VDHPFSIQSISKVTRSRWRWKTLSQGGLREDRLGTYRTSVQFARGGGGLPTHTGNPFVNAGAIATTSLITGANKTAKFDEILDFYSRAAGEKLT